MARDPVCKMDVNERTTPYKSSYNGQTYYFCSAGCKREFDTSPEKYESRGSAGAELGEKAGQFREAAREKGEQLAGKAQTRAKSMAASRKGQVAGGLDSVAQALKQTARQLHERRQGGIARYADKAAGRVSRLSGYLNEQDIDRIVDDVEDFARRQPALFLGGAFIAGVAMARFLKSSGSMPLSSGGQRPMPAEAEGEAAG